MTKIKGAIDITEIWTNKSKNGFVKYLHSYTYHGEIYKVDNFHVVLKPSKEEIEIAELLANKYGKRVLLVPGINTPKGIQTPDYIINGVKFDLKSPIGQGNSTLFNRVKNKRKQSKSFIFNLNNCHLSNNSITKQIEHIYHSDATNFINQIVLIKNSEILAAFKRKQGDPSTSHMSV